MRLDDWFVDPLYQNHMWYLFKISIPEASHLSLPFPHFSDSLLFPSLSLCYVASAHTWIHIIPSDSLGERPRKIYIFNKHPK